MNAAGFFVRCMESITNPGSYSTAARMRRVTRAEAVSVISTAHIRSSSIVCPPEVCDALEGAICESVWLA